MRLSQDVKVMALSQDVGASAALSKDGPTDPSISQDDASAASASVENVGALPVAPSQVIGPANTAEGGDDAGTGLSQIPVQPIRSVGDHMASHNQAGRTFVWQFFSTIGGKER